MGCSVPLESTYTLAPSPQGQREHATWTVIALVENRKPSKIFGSDGRDERDLSFLSASGSLLRSLRALQNRDKCRDVGEVHDATLVTICLSLKPARLQNRNKCGDVRKVNDAI